jgi:S-DNA-T family DNA segregation ATPase FtsK/SpoIIIE
VNVVGTVWAELHWWSRLVVHSIRQHPGRTIAAVGGSWLLAPLVPSPWWVVAGGCGVGLRAWAVGHPLSWQGLVAGPSRRVRWRIRIRRHWRDLALACDLGRPARTRGQKAFPLDVPRLLRVTTVGPRVAVLAQPLVGQTVDTFSQAAEQLRMGLGATRVRVEPDGVNRVLMTVTMRDALADPFPAERPCATLDLASDRVLMGRREDGSPWWMPVGPHTLVAGMSGAGKGSVFWSFAFGLAPAVCHGSVQLHGIDLKGGMEILMGADLFSSRATDSAHAVALLEDLVAQMRVRTQQYAGRTRSHLATPESPLHVVMIDELAALTAYCPERDLQRRAEMAVNLLCSQGRAPGFVVLACLQDPRKEVIPSRGLFTQMVGLRLKDVSETTMVLGDTAVASGALCHRITRSTPGTGYVVPEEGGYPVRVRAGFVSDADIRWVAREFATPVQHLSAPVLLPIEPARRSGRQSSGSEVA